MPVRALRTFRVEPVLPPELEPLRALAGNLYWTWNTGAAALFQRIDRERWQASGHNPVRLLQTVPAGTLAQLARDDGFLLELREVAEAFREYMSGAPRASVPGTDEAEVIAYFSLEFALTETLPNYSGGLGVLAGDHLKSASDLGLPLVGVGLLYQQGYFQQVLGPDGWQREEYDDIDVASQPVRRVRDGRGEPLTVQVPFDSRDVQASVWRLDVGRTPLFLLDSNLESNHADDRAISGRLYGGDLETRIQQEMLLGIGGIRALRAMGLRPAVCHMNEGHSALLGVDRIRTLMEETGASFDEARLPVSAATVFTTHTAVAAGIDLFPPDLVRKHLGHYYTSMGLDDHTFIGLGRTHPGDDNEPFSMAQLGLRLSGYRNGVSRVHRTVSRRLWASTWPDLPIEQVPIDSITNGVHLPTWVSHEMGNLYDRYIGAGWRSDPARPEIWGGLSEVPAQELWEVHERQRERLINRARLQHRDSSIRLGLAGTSESWGQVLDPGALTIGFARRFAGYKRATLLFRNPKRLARLLNHPERPIQFVFAGKAHPRDEPAKQLIREVVEMSRRPEFRDRLVLLERYDIELARALVQGTDVWMNTPLRPLEASGTSGMKAAANGVLNFSVMDGWWSEAYRPGLGWAIGRDRADDDPEVQDTIDAESIYDLLEQEVAPAFYERDVDGVPVRWVEWMKRSIMTLAPQFNTNRMVSEYARGAYAPAAASWHRLREDGLRPARALSAWLTRMAAGWQAIKVLSVEDDLGEAPSSNAPVTVTVQAHFGALQHTDVRLDVAFGPALRSGEIEIAGMAPLTFQEMREDGTCRFEGTFVAGTGGRMGYAIRLTPAHPDLRDPFLPGLARWA